MNSSNLLTLLCLGDVVGRPGRSAVQTRLRSLREARGVDLAIVNGENASGGVGIDPETAREIRGAGADIVTLGDHTWQRREAHPFLEEHSSWCIRPANYPAGAPGRGWATLEVKGIRVGVMNLLGRVFLNFPLDCPFRTADALLAGPLKGCAVIVCDMHAEATSEKMAMARHLDGRATLVFGTHTHVQTADEQILAGGTGFITDLGMCGGRESIIGMDVETAMKRFLTGLPHAYKIGRGSPTVNGIIATIDPGARRTLSIERVAEILPAPAKE